MTETELTTEIKTDTLGGMYFFWGDEDYMKNHRMLEIKKAVLGTDGDFDAFNCFSFVFGENECDYQALSDAFMAPPMMAERKFISIFFASLDSFKENQQVHDKTKLLEFLREYADETDSVVVINANSDGFRAMESGKPSMFLREMMKFAKCVEFPYRTDARLMRWMERHFAGYGLTADQRVMRSIIDSCGRGMFGLSGEIAKVAAHAAAAGKQSIDDGDVAACVIKNDVDEAFALSNCILRGDTAGAMACLHIKIKKREAPLLVLGQVARSFSDMCAARAFIEDGRDAKDFETSMKMASYRASNCYRAAEKVTSEYLLYAMDLCRDADKSLKSGVSGYMPIERLICLASRRAGR